jgi:cardiolipin synthase A/B
MNWEILEFLSATFLADHTHQWVQNITIPPSIVISPANARARIEGMIGSAQTRIILYVQTLSDPHIMSLLEEKLRQNVQLSICTAENDESIYLTGSLAPVWTRIKKPYIHSKVMIIDGKTVFIGSQNFSQNALENNREVGIILENPRFLSEIYQTIEKDCKIVP